MMVMMETTMRMLFGPTKVSFYRADSLLLAVGGLQRTTSPRMTSTVVRSFSGTSTLVYLVRNVGRTLQRALTCRMLVDDLSRVHMERGSMHHDSTHDSR